MYFSGQVDMSMQWDDFFVGESNTDEKAELERVIAAYDNEASTYDEFMETTFKVR